MTSDELQAIVDAAPPGSIVQVPGALVPDPCRSIARNGVSIQIGVSGITEVRVLPPKVSA